MVDVRRNDRPAKRDFTAHELWRDDFRDRGTETFAGMLLVGDVPRAHLIFHRLVGSFTAEVFADGNVFHLGCDDTLLGIPQLRDRVLLVGAQRLTFQPRECIQAAAVLGRLFGGIFLVPAAQVAIIDRENFPPLVNLHVPARFDPCGTQLG